MAVSDKNIARFKRAVKQLNKVIKDCQDDDADVFAFLDGNSSLYLMSGESQIGEDGVQDTILAYEQLNASGGDW